MNTEEAKTKAKNTCPTCGSSNTRHDYMKEEDVQYKIMICDDCFWWG